ncbi:hypothetical protein P7C70_g1187, partial [Phenoliferia sp. Uapishka_3]
MLKSASKRFVARSAKTILSRSVWRSSTALSTSPSALAAYFHATKPLQDANVTVLALSKNIPPPLVELIRAALSTDSSPIIGCLSEILPTPAAAHLGLDTPSEPYSVAVATYHPDSPNSRAIPFISSLQGRPNITLGREIKSGPRSDYAGDSSDEGFEAFISGKKWGFGENTRNGNAAEIQELKDVDVSSVKEIICFTSDRSQPFMKTLAGYTAASTVGLAGSLTPFHSTTGATYSLFHGKDTVSSGAVGVAIVDSAPPRPVSVEYAGLEPLEEPFEVTAGKGNIVLTLSGQNAARLLLHAVQKLPSSSMEEVSSQYTRQEEKEKEFFAAIFESQPGPDLSLARHVSKIMAGDPSRGAMSVDTEEEVKVGSWLVFLHRPSPTPVLPALLSPSPSSLTFLSIAPSYHEPKFSFNGENDEAVFVVEGFIAASENGVVLSRRGKESWVCGNEGATVSVGR